MNQTILIGRLCADPEMRVLQSGTATTRFTLAVDRAMSKEKKQEAERGGNMSIFSAVQMRSEE